MAWKRYSDEESLKLLREIDVHLHDSLDVVSACRKAGISDKTYCYWRKKLGGMGQPPALCPGLPQPHLIHAVQGQRARGLCGCV